MSYAQASYAALQLGLGELGGSVYSVLDRVR